MSGDRKLTPKQERFVEEYLVDLNASAAAKRAGYSVKNSGIIGAQLLNKTYIAEAISKRKKDRGERTEITQELIVQEVYKLYRNCAIMVPKLDFAGDPILDAEGKPVFQMIDPPTAKGALDMLMKHTGGYDADNSKKITGGLEIVWKDE